MPEKKKGPKKIPDAVTGAAKPAGPVFLTVGDLARRAGVAVSTLHFYEAEGLIRSMRTQANHRRYPRGMLRRVAIIKVAQKAGIPLKEIAEVKGECWNMELKT